MNAIVVYFSRAGSNWVEDNVANLKVGNNEIVANYIHSKVGGDLFKIETSRKYTDEYYKATEEAKEEKNNQERPEVLNLPENLDKYDTIYLCYPIWWGTCPMAVFTFLEHYDFASKTIIPFCSHEGSGKSESVDDIKKTCPNAIIKDYFETRGYKCQTLIKDNVLQNEINNWLEKTAEQ